MVGIGEIFHKAVNFIKQDVWRIPRTHLTPGKSFFLNILRIIVLSVRKFDEDKCQLRASALTFYSLISIVPVLAMAFGIAKGFGMEKVLEYQLRESLAGHEEVFDKIIQFSHSLLANTQGGLIAGIGLVTLFWAVIKVLGQMEYSFNDIWGVKNQRTISRKFADYLSLMLICPVILILSSGVTVFVSTQLDIIMETFTMPESFTVIVFYLLKILPYTLIWALFTFIYIFMPNTNVRLSSAVCAGIITGTIFQIVQWVYITFQVGMVEYNTIYGSFAALPLFLVWLQLSWLIILYGAELSFAYQNVDAYEFEQDAFQVSHHLRTLLSLHITRLLIKNFSTGEKPLTAHEISNRLDIPISLVNDVLFELVESNILSKIEIEGGEEPGYQPALDPDKLTIQYVVNAMEQRGLNYIPFIYAAEFADLSASLEAFAKTIEKLSENQLLKEM